MFKSLVSLFTGGSLWGFVIAAGAAALIAGVGAGVLTHKVDMASHNAYVIKADAKYNALVLADANDRATTAETNLRNFEAFAAKQAMADKAAQDRLNQLEAERAAAGERLDAVLAKEGKADATLAVCLSHKLPRSVLESLTK